MDRVQARNKYNKLKLRDNRVLTIVSQSFNLSGFYCYLYDEEQDEKVLVGYKDYSSFLQDFNVVYKDEDIEEYREFI